MDRLHLDATNTEGREPSLKTFTEYKEKTRGIFRIWTNVDIFQNISEQQARKAPTAYYTPKTEISSASVRHKSFIDYFPGQASCLKQNWNPTWGLHSTTEAVVVGICFEQYDAEQAHATINDIIERTIQEKRKRYNTLVKPSIPFHGEAAHPVSTIASYEGPGRA